MSHFPPSRQFSPQHVRGSVRVACVLLATALLSGCNRADPEASAWSVETPWRQLNQPSATYATDSHMITFGEGEASLSRSGENGLRQFLRERITAIPRDDIALHMGYARTDRVTAERVSLVSDIVAQEVPNARITPYFRSSIDGDGALLTVGRYVVDLPDCPSWSTPSNRNLNTTGSRNLGCASASTHAQMLEDPADLLRGRGSPEEKRPFAYTPDSGEEDGGDGGGQP